MRVLLDCDGVLADFVGGWLSLINADRGTSHTLADVTDWDICASIGIPEGERGATKRLLAEFPGFAGQLEVIPGALDGVRRLQQIAEVYIVTSSWDSHPTWEYDRKAWLKRHFEISSDKIIFAHDKHVCVGDALIDDRTDTLAAWMTHHNGVPIQWQTPHNRKDGWAGFSTNNWDELIGWLS